MTKKYNTDILVLKKSVKALTCSTSQKMLHANIEYLIDYFLRHPNQELLRVFKEREAKLTSGPEKETNDQDHKTNQAP